MPSAAHFRVSFSLLSSTKNLQGEGVVHNVGAVAIK